MRQPLFASLLAGILICFFAASGNLGAQVRLTEILPVSTSTDFPDDDGSAQGWIELWNSDQATAVVLTGYKLSNGTTSWTFPNVEIMPDERIIVWASGKNRVNPEAPLHTNFTLPAAGGTIRLSDASNALVSQLQNVPALAANISWGRDEWDGAVTPAFVGSYATPTPGGRNNYSGAGVAGNVTIGTTSRAFTASFTVTLTTSSTAPGTVIRYTTDRSIPSSTSTAYTAPISITSTKMIRARAFATGLLPGATATEAYLQLDATAAAFTSTMPLVVVTNFLSAAPSTDKSDQAGFMWTWQPASAGASVRLTDPPASTARVRLSRRGSSTLGNAKYNLSIETRNAWDDDELDVPLLGMPAHSDWVFHAPFAYDPALLRNPFIHDLSNQLGDPAPRHKMAEVFLSFKGTALRSSGSTNEYYGVYNILEEIGRNKNRSNLEKLTTYDNDAVKKTGGYIWKIDRSDSSDAFTAGSVSLVYDYPKGEAIKSPQRDPQEKYLTQFLNSFNTAATALNHDPVTGYPAYLDIIPTIDHHLLNVWAFNVDGLRLSAFWHKDRGGKFAAGPTWDFDRAMSSTDGRDSDPAQWRASTQDLGTDFFNGTDSRRWWHYLFRDIDFYQQYIDRWQELRRGAFSATNINTLLDSLNAEMSADAIARDLAKWNNAKRAWTSPFTGQVYPASQTAEVQRIKDYMQQRANFFDSQWVGQVDAPASPGELAAGSAVTLTGPSGAVIYYTLDGSDPRPAGGAAPTASNVKTYATPIIINSPTRIRTRAYKASHTALTGANKPPLLSKWGGSRDLSYTIFFPEYPALMHYWNFNNPGTLLAPTETIGGGNLAIVTAPPDTIYEAGTGQSFAGTNARNTDPTSSHLRVNDPIASSLTFALPTTGYRNIFIRYETRRSGSGAGTQRILYTVDGTNYTDFATRTIHEASPAIETLDFRWLEAASDNPSFGIRILFQQGAGGTVGNNRFDNFTVEGQHLAVTGPELLRYALGAGTGQALEDHFPELAAGGHGLRFAFASGKRDIIYRVQRSIDLVNWEVIFDSRIDAWASYLDGTHLVIPDPSPPPDRAYYRLAVSQD